MDPCVFVDLRLRGLLLLFLFFFFAPLLDGLRLPLTARLDFEAFLGLRFRTIRLLLPFIVMEALVLFLRFATRRRSIPDPD